VNPVFEQYKEERLEQPISHFLAAILQPISILIPVSIALIHHSITSGDAITMQRDPFV
jgi:hypothetical protein